jgi:hypothetical protein
MAKRKEKDRYNTFNEKLSKEIEEINKLEYNQINWYDLHSEVDKINSNLNEEEIQYLIYKFDELFVLNNAKVNFDDKNIVMYRVLEELLNSYTKLSIPFHDLKAKEYSIDSGVNTAFSNITNIFDLYNIAKSEVIGVNNQKGLYSSIDKWFENSSYKILDYEVLQKLAPVITSYISVGCFSEFNIQKLFSRLSEIIEYSMLPSVLHNKFLDLENEVVIAINEKEQIGISVKDKNKFKDIEVKPIKIKYEDGKKILVYENMETNTIEEVELFKCSLETTNDADFEPFTPYNTNSYFSVSDMKKTKKSPKIEEIKLLLECDSIVYEYFNILPLSNMIIYDSEEKKKEFMVKYKYDCMPNKFYIEALDYKEKCISVIFQCMQNVKVIEPSFLNDDIIGRIEVFARRNNIDYTRRIAEKKKSELEEQRRKEQEAKSKIEEKTIENIDIDTKGIVQKIKDNKPKDMNF